MFKEFVNPCLCGLSLKEEDLKRFNFSNYIIETKFDGERVLMFVDFEKNYFRIQSREVFDKTYVYPEFSLELMRSVLEKGIKNIILDGEVIAKSGKFEDLAKRSHLSDKLKISIMVNKIPLVYVVFDILFCNGVDMRNMPLVARRYYLSRVLKPNTSVVLSENFDNTDVKQLFKMVVSSGFEGLIAKQVNSAYENKRSKSWIKIKKENSEILKVLGWNERSGRGFYGSVVTPKGNVGLLSMSNKEEYDRLVREKGLGNFSVEVRFMEEYSSGKKRFPIFVRFV
jgi:ATP-dependent DNA ligase